MNSQSTISAAPLALVTGGARRLGQAIALALAAKGWDIAVHYRNSADEAQKTVQQIQALGRQAIAVQADLSDESQVKLLLQTCAEQLGEVQCVVNNASLFEYDNAEQFSYASLNQHMQANLAAPVMLACELHRRLHVNLVSGVVINLLDQKLYNYNPDFLSYTLSKAALQAATTMLAQALAPQVRVVGVAPGITLPSGQQTEAAFFQAHQVTPLQRSSTPADIANAVCFAVESKAMTGTTLLIDGGQHLMPSQRDVMFGAAI